MSNKNSAMGLVLKSNTRQYERIVSDADKNVLPEIQAVKEAYERLSVGEFSPDVWADIQKGDLKGISSRYMAQAEKDAAGFKTKSIKENLLQGAKEDLKKFKDVVKHLHWAVDTLNGIYPGGAEKKYLRLADFQLTENGFTFNQKAIADRCNDKIGTEKQAELYGRLTSLVQNINDFSTFMEAGGYKFGYQQDIRDVIGTACLLTEDGKLDIDPDFIVNTKLK